jgi:RNA:NAD 2'-phosphotransferase (TPT1/KptA family)
MQVVLKIKALLMHEQGFKFFQAENGAVPVLFIPEQGFLSTARPAL